MQAVTGVSKNRKPDIAVQVFLSLVKWFLLFILINNAIWASVRFGYVAKSFNGTAISAEMNQTENNYTNQSITNG